MNILPNGQASVQSNVFNIIYSVPYKKVKNKTIILVYSIAACHFPVSFLKKQQFSTSYPIYFIKQNIPFPNVTGKGMLLVK